MAADFVEILIGYFFLISRNKDVCIIWINQTNVPILSVICTTFRSVWPLIFFRCASRRLGKGKVRGV